ncbi:universal stress protein [Mucilaginibacter ximonensis]|uniref:Universal stress protein n=1 Tax=Mucilaginibacter ximonensis TaxID=538021 RepID=A0ABW5Y7G4_9SPHI
MKQILVATDFSKSAANAMAYAMNLAVVLGKDVCAIHAIHPTEGVDNNTYNAIFIEDYHNNKRAALEEWVSEFRDNQDYKQVKVTTVCNVGFLKKVIAQYIKAHPVDLLVMGVIGSTGISSIVGSNTSSIVTRIKFPTLIVPLESKFAETPMITLATDFETRLSAIDVKTLNEMIKAFGSKKMQVLYVNDDPEKRTHHRDEERLSDLIKHTTLNFNYIKNDSPLDGIIDFVQNDHTDILCLVKHHHNVVYRLFTRSTVNRVLNRALKAVLVLHE